MGDEDVKKVISSSEGEMQTWRGMGITDDEIEKFQKFVDKMKKSLGKDIETKNDKKDEQPDIYIWRIVYEYNIKSHNEYR